MGLFSKKKTYVGSTIFNMAGDEKDRPNFLRTSIGSKVLTNDPRMYGEFLQNTYIRGPSIKLQSFFRWAKDNMNVIGMPKSTISQPTGIDNDVIAQVVPAPQDSTVKVLKVDVGYADYKYWAEQWMLENEPTLMNTEWGADFHEATNEIEIIFEDDSTTRIVPLEFDVTKEYIYITYRYTTGQETKPNETGIIQEVTNFPSTNGWTSVSKDPSSRVINLTTTIEDEITYSDDRPEEEDSSSSGSDFTANEFHDVYERTIYAGQDDVDDSIANQKQVRHFWEFYEVEEQVTVTNLEEDAGGGVTRYIKRTTTTEVAVKVREIRTDTQDTVLQSWGPVEIFIYQTYTGIPALDDMIRKDQGDAQYYPIIPFRINEQMVSPTMYPAAYAEGKKAFKKSVNGNFDKLIKQLNAHDKIKDMEFVYAIFGVSLNVKDNAAKKYLYHYFKKLMEYPSYNNTGYYSWELSVAQQMQYNALWNQWKLAQSNPSSPLFGTPEPTLQTFTPPPSKEIRINAPNLINAGLDISIKWTNIVEFNGTGLGKPGAKKGDLWMTSNVQQNHAGGLYSNGQIYNVNFYTKDVVRLYWQYEDNAFRGLDLYGLYHKNTIWKGKYVEIYGTEAVNDVEESGFVLPLHYPTMKEMSLVDSTQMSSACCFLLINSYVVKKTGLLGSLFKIFSFILVIVLTVTTGFGGLAGAGGLLGSNVAVGAAIGLTGLAGAIVGAAVNAIAAMLVLKVIGKVSSWVFGEKFGALIGAIVGMVVLSVGTSFAMGQAPILNWTELSRIDNIMRLTSVAGGAISSWNMTAAQEKMKETEKLVEDYNKQAREIQKRYEEEFGYGNAVLDPLDLLRAYPQVESGDAFLTRTLMTGSDLIDFQMTLLHDFTNLTLSTELQ